MNYTRYTAREAIKQIACGRNDNFTSSDFVEFEEFNKFCDILWALKGEKPINYYSQKQAQQALKLLK